MRRVLLPTLLLCFVASTAPAQQAAEVDKSAVDAAVQKAFTYLRSVNASHLAAFKFADRKMLHRELVVYTYVIGGAGEGAEDFRILFDDMMKDRLETTYGVALQAMALEELDRVKYQNRIAQCALFLVDNQNPQGGWGYGEPTVSSQTPDAELRKKALPGPAPPALPPKEQPGLRMKPLVKDRIKIQKTREGSGAASLSNFHYAALGLRACHDAGIIIPASVTEQAMKWLRTLQKKDSLASEDLVESPPSLPVKKAAPLGWCYGDHADHKAYGSMTAAGVSSLAIWDYIKDNDEGKKKSWKKDPDLHKGLQWLARNYSVEFNPGPNEQRKMEENSRDEHYYYLHALSGAGLMYGTEVFGKHSWYSEGAKLLVQIQDRSGRFGGNSADTCFAVLFLMRATRWLSPPP